MTTAIVPYQEIGQQATLVELYNTVIAANMPILPVNVAPTTYPAIVTVTAAFPVSGVLDVVVVTEEYGSKTLHLNEGVQLEADCMYSFAHFLSSGESLNYIYSATCASQLITVHSLSASAERPTASLGLDMSSLFSSMITMMIVMMMMGMMMKTIATEDRDGSECIKEYREYRR